MRHSQCRFRGSAEPFEELVKVVTRKFPFEGMSHRFELALEIEQSMLNDGQRWEIIGSKDFALTMEK